MTDPAQPPKFWERLLTRLAVTLAGLVLLYALSLGPAVRWALEHPRWIPFLNGFYQPLAWVSGHTPLGKVIKAYANWWLRLPLSIPAQPMDYQSPPPQSPERAPELDPP